jgi:hypothetical protein
MTDKIYELIKQSEVSIGHPKCFSGYIDINKFTELIVRECANHCDLLLDHKISSEWSRGTHDCSRAIKKHFGVEE